MPFTLAHPAAILPFLRQPFVPIALIAGAMAPDIPYFAMVSSTSESWYEPFLNGTNSHDFAQILSVGLPLALVLAGFLWLVARPLRWATPDAWLPTKTPATGRKPSSARIALWTFYSLMLGLVTHLAWDSLTHGGGRVVQLLPVLSTELFSGFPVYRILQHLSTVVGLLVLLWWYVKRVKASRAADTSTETSVTRFRTALVGLILLVPAALAAGIGVSHELTVNAELGAGIGVELGIESLLWIAITRGGAALLLAATAYGLVWQGTALFIWLRTRAHSRA